MRKLVVIVGPTAVGKSALAVRLARKFRGEVISADSRQVYRGLTIGTGKITKREMGEVRHHLLDVASPRRQYSVARFVMGARRAILDITRRGKLPIICGGTGLYIDALLGKVSFPNVPPNKELRKKLAGKTAGELFNMLKNIDLARAKKIEKNNSERNNPHRLIRHIELAKFNLTNRTKFSDTYINSDRSLCMYPGRSTTAQTNKPIAEFNVLKIGLCVPPDELRRRIHARLLARMRQGMIAEARRLHQNGLSFKQMEKLGLEYRYLARYLQDKITRAEMFRKLQTEIWRYAKRQMTWFKRDERIRWFKPNEGRVVEKEARNFLEH
ncbi:MAG: tRNA (adenosine(37)-N6)-dimethylallyltransferase MiaA [Patescibacteria group bacterium]